MNGEDLYKKAGQEVNKMFFKDYDKAQELFMKAGAAFKVEKNWARAGEAYMASGDIAIKQKNPGDACQMYTEAASCFRKCDMRRAEVMIQSAIQLNIENNRLGAAAKMEKDWAEALEAENDMENAVLHFKKAYDYFYAEDQPTSALTCLVRVANAYGDMDKFKEAIPLFEQIATQYVTGPLKHQAKEFAVRALLCRLALVTTENWMEASQDCQEAWERYIAQDANLRHTREQEYCEMLLDSMEEGDTEKFDDAVATINENRQLDDWKAHVLLTCKNNFEDIR